MPRPRRDRRAPRRYSPEAQKLEDDYATDEHDTDAGDASSVASSDSQPDLPGFVVPDDASVEIEESDDEESEDSLTDSESEEDLSDWSSEE